MPRSPSTRTSTPTRASCSDCGQCPCPAAIRGDTPPIGLLDFLDRWIARLASSHWTRRQTGHLLVTVAAIALLLALTGLIGTIVLREVVSPAGNTSPALRWAAGGGVLGVGSSYAVRRVRSSRSTTTR